MSQTVVERTAEHIAESAHQASRASSAIADAFEDGVGVMRSAAKQSGEGKTRGSHHTPLLRSPFQAFRNPVLLRSI